MDVSPIRQIGDVMRAYTEQAQQRRLQPEPPGGPTRVETQRAEPGPRSQHAQEEAEAERARQRRAEEAPRNNPAVGGRIDRYA
jgi:hypothetical protein